MIDDAVPTPPRALPAFEPHELLRCGHRQTIAGAYLPSRYERDAGERQLVELTDGDRLAIYDRAPDSWAPGHRIAALYHGLGGTYQSSYVMRTADKLRRRGVRTVCVNMRGYGVGMPLAAKPGHAGRSEDADAVARFLAEKYPGSPLTMVGFSLGGNVVLKLAGELGSEPHPNIDSCWAAAPPMTIARCAENMRARNRRLYTRNFLAALLRQYRQARRVHAALREIPIKPRPQTIDEFDDRFTAPLSGFRDVQHYYEEASAAPRLQNIRIPTQIIAAEDDPIVPVDVFQTARVSSTTELHITSSGGHLGYIADGRTDADRRWLDWRVVDWVMQQGLVPRQDAGGLRHGASDRDRAACPAEPAASPAAANGSYDHASREHRSPRRPR